MNLRNTSLIFLKISVFISVIPYVLSIIGTNIIFTYYLTISLKKLFTNEKNCSIIIFNKLLYPGKASTLHQKGRDYGSKSAGEKAGSL